jgi:hypothetical protein
VGKINIQRVRGDIRALGHKADIAKIALVNDLIVFFAVKLGKFACFRIVNQVEKGWEGIAKVETAAATMTDVKHTRLFIQKLFLIIEIWVLPGNSVPHGRLEIAFTNTHGVPFISKPSKEKEKGR